MRISLLVLLFLSTGTCKRHATGGHSGIFSSHHCIGGNEHSYNAGSRTCILFNVCHTAGSGDNIEYYVDDSRPRKPVYSENNSYYYDFGTAFISLGVYPFDNYVGRKWSPTMVASELPQFPFDKNASINLFLESHAEYNPAEFLGFLHAMYALPLMHGHAVGRDIKLFDAAFNRRRKKHRSELMHGVTAHDAEYLEDLGDICFDNLIVGAGMMSVLHTSPFASLTVDKFVSFLLTNLELHEAKQFTRHVILILMKNPRQITHPDCDGPGYSNEENHIVNIVELSLYLEETFAPVADVRVLMPDHMSWSQQIEAVRAASVIITAGGGGGFLAMFARDGASIIFLDRFYEVSDRFRSGMSGKGGLEDSWWSVMHNFHKFHYPVCSLDELVAYNNIIVVMRRMQHVVVLALLEAMRWPEMSPAVVQAVLSLSAGHTPDICGILDN